MVTLRKAIVRKLVMNSKPRNPKSAPAGHRLPDSSPFRRLKKAAIRSLFIGFESPAESFWRIILFDFREWAPV
jgi:hypothetical protein